MAETERQQQLHDSLVLAQWKGADIDKAQRDIRNRIVDIKRRAGLLGSADPEFAEFFKNWRQSSSQATSVSAQRASLRWILRKLAEPVKSVTV